jgi:hypothetical protein
MINMVKYCLWARERDGESRLGLGIGWLFCTGTRTPFPFVSKSMVSHQSGSPRNSGRCSCCVVEYVPYAWRGEWISAEENEYIAAYGET